VLGFGNVVTDDFAVWVEGHYDNMILAANNSVRVGRKMFDDVPLAAFMNRLFDRLSQRVYRAPLGASAALDRVSTPARLARTRFAALRAKQSAAADDRITYDRFFDRIKTWLDDSMVLLADTSIALYSAAELPVRQRNGFIAQAAWNSIGYTPGGAVGVCYAALDKRAVVFCGDGGFQEIVQAASDIVRSTRDAVVFVFTNALYGIEQAFVDPYYFVPDKTGKRHPPETFCLLQAWNYAALTDVLGGGWSAKVETMEQLETALTTAKSTRGLSLIDVRIPQDSITPQMLLQAGVTP
jgi:indolepyruvate decarboxylase